MSEPGQQPESEPAQVISVRRMLTELALPAGLWREEHKWLEDHFAAALDPLFDLLRNAESKGSGEAHFAVRQLLARAMTDLIASLHLITHGYLNQAYETMRMAYETLDLVELLATDYEQAELWVNTERGHIDFRAGAVRERLGKERYDPIYGQLSELAHPRFAASKLSAIGKREEGSDELSIVVRIGPFLLDETADLWLAAGFLPILLGKLSVRLSHLVLMGAVPEGDWDSAVQTSHAAIAEMGRLIAERLMGFGLKGAEGFGSEFQETARIIAEANAELPPEE